MIWFDLIDLVLHFSTLFMALVNTGLKKLLDRATYCSQLQVFVARNFDQRHFDWNYFDIGLRTVASENAQLRKSKGETLDYAFGCN